MHFTNFAIIVISLLSASQNEIPIELKKVWIQFKTAVQTHDVTQIGTMTRFPLKSNLSIGNIKDIDSLKNNYKHIFKPIMIKNINTKQPEKDANYNGYIIDFGSDDIPLIIGFEKNKNTYKWTYIEEFH